MLDAFAHVNWLATALAALSYYLLGVAWFTPLFGQAWDRSIGYDRSPTARFGPAYYVVPLVSAVFVALARPDPGRPGTDLRGGSDRGRRHRPRHPHESLDFTRKPASQPVIACSRSAL